MAIYLAVADSELMKVGVSSVNANTIVDNIEQRIAFVLNTLRV